MPKISVTNQPREIRQVAVPMSYDYIREWFVLGPFFSEGLETDFLADAGVEANVEPKEGGTVTTEDGRTLQWKRYKSKTYTMDLVDAVGDYEHATAYAFCALRSEAGGDAGFYLASGNSVAVWINGEQVHRNPVDQAFSLDQAIFEVDLEAGDNHCLIRVSNRGLDRELDWGFAMRATMLPTNRAVLSGLVTHETGQPIPNANVRVEQDEEEIAQTQTDVSGSYRLNIHPVRGKYDLAATSGSMGDWQLGIQLDEGERQRLDLTLKEAVSIEGILLMLDDSTPHVAVVVQAVTLLSGHRRKPSPPTPLPEEGGESQVVATTLSDESGKYRFINLKPGRYQVRCYTLDGYIYYQKGEILQVGCGETHRSIDFRFAPFKKGTWKNYDSLDGLAYNNVIAICRDNDGALWSGTWGGGVCRYDGKEFLNFTTRDGLLDPVVWDVYCAPDGVMWFGTPYGASRYDGKEFRSFTQEDGLAYDWVNAVYGDSHGIMWFGTLFGVSRYDGKEFKNFTTEDGLVHNFVSAVYCDPDGTIWFGTLFGVSRYDGKEFKNFTQEDGLVHNRINAVHGDSHGMIWFGTDRGVSRYDGKKFESFTPKDGLPDSVVWDIYCAPDGVVWFGTRAGVSRYDGNMFVNFTTEDGLGYNKVGSVYGDPDGILWFGTGGDPFSSRGGISRYDEKTFTNFTTKDALAHNNVGPIYRGSDGTLWFGTSDGISQYNGNQFSNLTVKDGLLHNYIIAIHRDPDGIMWFAAGYLFAGGGGVSRYDGKEFKNFTTRDGLAGESVWDIYRDPDGILWFGTWDGGISRYDGRAFTNFTIKDGLASNRVTCIQRDLDGNMWFGLDRDGASCYDGKEFKNFTTEDGLVGNMVMDMYCSPDGVLWFGTWDGGVSRYDGRTFVNFTTEDGLASNNVVAIYRAPNGVLWFGTDGGGVSGYDGVAWTSLDTREGLANNNVGKITHDSDGYLWFATRGGITRYRPSTTPPRVYIVSVTTDETYRDVSAIPVLKPGIRVTIEYNSIDLKTVPEKRQYRCRIKEIDSDWRKPTEDTSFDYTFDKPGTYTFQLQAIDRDLNYSLPATLNLTVQPDPVLVSMKTELNHLRREVQRKYHFENIIGCSDSMKYVYALMEKAIDSGLTVLITGETGTGKELVAKAIHFNSPRRDHPLLARNCGAIPKDLLASDLFGHSKGAFTGAEEDKVGLFEAAAGGTVLLDEIGDMPEDAQIHLLRVLEERKVQHLGEHISRDIDVRVIAMTNRPLLKEVESGRFREDLYYRLSVFPIHIPPLRERMDDIPLLAEHFLEEVEREFAGFASDVFDMLKNYSWPGNVRELRNTVHRAAALTEEGEQIQVYHFPSQITHGGSLIQEILSERLGLSESLKLVQRRMVEDALRECDGSRTKAAQMLKIHRPNLVRLMRDLGIK